MKQIKCEMCGSNNLIKTDNIFLCRNCGVKYTVEEARKLMDESSENAVNKVKIDSSDKLNNLYQIARQASQSNNHDDAARYYDMILLEEPNSWEANFFRIYHKAMQCTIGEIPAAADLIKNCLIHTFHLIDDNEDMEDKQESYDLVVEKVLNFGDTLYFNAISHFRNYSSGTNVGGDLCKASGYISDMWKTLAFCLKNVCKDNASAISVYKHAVEKLVELNDIPKYYMRKLSNDYIIILEDHISELEPTYQRIISVDTEEAVDNPKQKVDLHRLINKQTIPFIVMIFGVIMMCMMFISDSDFFMISGFIGIIIVFGCLLWFVIKNKLYKKLKNNNDEKRDDVENMNSNDNLNE